MTLQDFNKRGTLDKGIHRCTSEEFLQRFCLEDDKVRSQYKEVLEQLFALSVHRGVKSVIIAGSFITDKKEPSDLDCIIVFPNEESVSIQLAENLILENCELDVMCVVESNKQLIYSMINMFALDKFGLEVGLVEVSLDLEKDGSTWSDYKDYYSVHTLMEARAAYIFRHVLRGVPKKKILVTICNYEEFWYWNYKIAPVVSSSGWIFAPYIYNTNNLVEHIDHFDSWIKEIYFTYETEISIFADGFGTYLLGEYFKSDSVYKNVYFDKIIMSRSVLNSTFDWGRELNSSHINLIINLRDSYKRCVINEKMDKRIKKNLMLGDSFVKGFNNKYQKLIDYQYDYKSEIRALEFTDSILPLFHLSETLIKNHEREQRNNMTELMEIMQKEISINDIFNK